MLIGCDPRDSDVPVSYGGYTRGQGHRVNRSRPVNWARENNRFAAWMSSNCFDYNRRQEVVAEFKVSQLDTGSQLRFTNKMIF